MLLHRLSIVASAIIAIGGVAIATKPNFLSPQVINQNDLPTHNRGKSGKWLENLNLTPQQLQQIEEIRSQSKAQMAQKKQAMRQSQQELHDLIAGTASQEQVREKYNQIKIIKQQLADIQFDNILAIREILNPQQRQKFADRMYKKRMKDEG